MNNLFIKTAYACRMDMSQYQHKGFNIHDLIYQFDTVSCSSKFSPLVFTLVLGIVFLILIKSQKKESSKFVKTFKKVCMVLVGIFLAYFLFLTTVYILNFF